MQTLKRWPHLIVVISFRFEMGTIRSQVGVIMAIANCFLLSHHFMRTNSTSPAEVDVQISPAFYAGSSIANAVVIAISRVRLGISRSRV